MNELDLHVSPTLYARLRRAAKQAKISVSEFAQRELARVSTSRSAPRAPITGARGRRVAWRSSSSAPRAARRNSRP